MKKQDFRIITHANLVIPKLIIFGISKYINISTSYNSAVEGMIF